VEGGEEEEGESETIEEEMGENDELRER